MTDDLEQVVATVGDPAGWLVVLDFDGTLSPIVDDPDAAALAPGAAEAVAALAARTAVVVLSGRPVDDLLPRVGDLPVTLAGGHGTEVRLPDGRRTPLFDAETAREVLGDAEQQLREVVDEEAGWLVEPKPASIAVHHRRVADPAEVLDAVRATLLELADAPPGWEVLDGKAVTELRPAGVDKGTALQWLAARHPGLRPLVVGDDVTDEDAFRAAMAAGGHAVLVSRQEADTEAPHRIHDPVRVVTLLRRLVVRNDVNARDSSVLSE